MPTPAELADAIRLEVRGEEIIWIGRPSARKAFLAATPAWLMGVPWTVFSVFWTSIPLGALLFSKGPSPLGGWGVAGMGVAALWGLPFVAIGFAMLAAPWWAARQANQVAYVLTPDRLRIIRLGRTKSVSTIFLDAIVRVERKEKADGSGTLAVIIGHYRDSDGDVVEKREELAGIPGVAALEAEITARIRPPSHTSPR